MEVQTRLAASGADFLLLDSAIEVADAIEKRLKTDDYRASILKSRLDIESFLLCPNTEELVDSFTSESKDGNMPKGDISKIRRLQTELREAAFIAQDPRLSDELVSVMELQKRARLSVSSASYGLPVQLPTGSPESEVRIAAPEELKAVVKAGSSDLGSLGDSDISGGGQQITKTIQDQEEKTIVPRGSRSLDAKTLTATELFWNLGRPGAEMQAIIGLNNCKRLIQLQHDLNYETLARVGNHNLTQLRAFDWKSSRADQELRDDILRTVAQRNRGGLIKALGRDWLWPVECQRHSFHAVLDEQKKILREEQKAREADDQAMQALYGTRVALFCRSGEKSETLVGEGTLVNASENQLSVEVAMVPEGINLGDTVCEGDTLSDLGFVVGSVVTWPRLSETTNWNGADNPQLKDPKLQKRPKVASKTRARLERATQVALPGTESTKTPLLTRAARHTATVEPAAPEVVHSHEPDETEAWVQLKARDNIDDPEEERRYRAALHQLYLDSCHGGQGNTAASRRAEKEKLEEQRDPEYKPTATSEDEEDDDPKKVKKRPSRKENKTKQTPSMEQTAPEIDSPKGRKLPAGLHQSDPTTFTQGAPSHEDVEASPKDDRNGGRTAKVLLEESPPATTKKGAAQNGRPPQTPGQKRNGLDVQRTVAGGGPTLAVPELKESAAATHMGEGVRSRGVAGAPASNSNRAKAHKPGSTGHAPEESEGLELSKPRAAKALEASNIRAEKGAVRSTTTEAGVVLGPSKQPAPRVKDNDTIRRQGGKEPRGGGVDSNLGKRKSVLDEGESAKRIRPNEDSKGPPEKDPVEEGPQAGLLGRGGRRDAKDRHDRVTHLPECGGFKDGCPGCKLSAVELEKAQLPPAEEIDMLDLDESESQEESLDARTPVKTRGELKTGAEVERGAKPKAGAKRGRPTKQKAEGKSKGVPKRKVGVKLKEGEEPLRERVAPNVQPNDEEAAVVISDELKTKYRVVCVVLLAVETFNQLTGTALAEHLVKTYPQTFKSATQRLKKLAQSQLLRIVAERALRARKVIVTAQADWRTSSKHLKKADVKVLCVTAT